MASIIIEVLSRAELGLLALAGICVVSLASFAARNEAPEPETQADYDARQW